MILKYNAKELNEHLSRFFAEIRKSDRSEFEQDSLRVMLAALNRHQRQNQSKISTAKERELMVCRQVLGGKSKSSSQERLRKTTKCNKSFTARGMLDNFEISLEVLLPNITTAHTITYINYNFLALIRFIPYGYHHL